MRESQAAAVQKWEGLSRSIPSDGSIANRITQACKWSLQEYNARENEGTPHKHPLQHKVHVLMQWHIHRHSTAMPSNFATMFSISLFAHCHLLVCTISPLLCWDLVIFSRKSRQKIIALLPIRTSNTRKNRVGSDTSMLSRKSSF